MSPRGRSAPQHEQALAALDLALDELQREQAVHVLVDAAQRSVACRHRSCAPFVAEPARRCGTAHRLVQIAEALGLLAGGTVRRAALEAGARLPARNGTACRTVDRWRCPTDEQPQRPVVRPLLLALCQRLRMDRPEPRTAVRIHHCDHDLRATWRVEHDPIKYGTDAGDLHELTYRDHLHQPSLLAGRPAVRRERETDPRAAGASSRNRSAASPRRGLDGAGGDKRADHQTEQR